MCVCAFLRVRARRVRVDACVRVCVWGEPLSVSDLRESQRLRHALRTQCTRLVLLIRKNLHVCV